MFERSILRNRNQGKAQELGCIMGSSSDPSLAAQQNIWEQHNIQADFVSLKHLLDDLKQRFQADRYLHIGDRDLDRQFAEQAGFDFFWAHEAHPEPWLAWLNGVGDGGSAPR